MYLFYWVILNIFVDNYVVIFIEILMLGYLFFLDISNGLILYLIKIY